MALGDVDKIKCRSQHTLTHFYTTSVCLTLSKPGTVDINNYCHTLMQEISLKSHLSSIPMVCVGVPDSSLHLPTSVECIKADVDDFESVLYSHLHSFHM